MGRMIRCNQCNRISEVTGTAGTAILENVFALQNGTLEGVREELWLEDFASAENIVQSDPQSGDVTDGSVDYYDFDWGEMVVYPEETMEPKLPNCDGVCGCGCFQSCGEEIPESDSVNPCTGTSGCGNNLPQQQDGMIYDIVSE